MKLFSILVLYSLVVSTEQKCCLQSAHAWELCKDHWGCDWVCCNCDDRCPDSNYKRSVSEGLSGAQQYFTSIDANGDGLISKEEGREFLANATASGRVKREASDWFAKTDKDGNGFIQPAEFDESLA